MCGIALYVGNENSVPFILQGLRRLEYRGYDSAGIAVINEKGELDLVKTKGRLSNLEDSISKNPIKGNLGIGHTRWATHGEPSDTNSHPHTSCDGKVSVVHNGIIENYIEIKEKLIDKGFEFYTETDTEVIPNLISYYYDGDILAAVKKAVSYMRGSYSLGVISSNDPDKIIAVRRDSPLIIGLGENEYYAASDIPAIIKKTKKIYLLEDDEFVTLTKNGVKIEDFDGDEIKKEIFEVTWDESEAEKDGYEHFMIKEIYEQPRALRDTLRGKIELGKKINLDGINFTKEEILNFDKIYIVACGTAYNAGFVGKYIFEKQNRIPIEIDFASEFRYRDPLITNKSLVIFISQSGETADTVAAIRLSKEKGAKTIAITNVVGSTISREADSVFYTMAGPEIAVASTKAYVTQLLALNILSLYFVQVMGNKDEEYIEEMKKQMLKVPEMALDTICLKDKIQKFASENYRQKVMFFIGRGIDYSVALEAALKVKEISYIQAEAYAAGELKHGPIALIQKGVPVIAISTMEHTYEKMLSSIKEVKARGAKVLSFVMEKNVENMDKVSDLTKYISDCNEFLSPILSVIPMQLLAYYLSVQNGFDVDKPRNLAKSVTVE